MKKFVIATMIVACIALCAAVCHMATWSRKHPSQPQKPL